MATCETCRAEKLEAALRDMADVVAIWAMHPPHPTRKRDPIAQGQWDQLAAVVSEMLRKTLKENSDASSD